MTLFSIGLLIFTLVIIFSYLRYTYIHYSNLKMVQYTFINEKDTFLKEDKKAIDILYLSFMTTNSLHILYETTVKAGSFSFGLLILPILNLVLTLGIPYLLYTYLRSKKSLVNNVIKETGFPLSYVDFMVDAKELILNKPEYLTGYSYNLIQSYSAKEPVRFEDYIHYGWSFGKVDPNGSSSILKNKSFDFPLYTELVDMVRILDMSLKDEELGLGKSLIIDCTLDSMLFLTTSMSIFKDESLVKSLSSDLGFEELLILGDKFKNFKESIESINKFILKKNKVILKFKESKVIVDDLNTIRSMNSFVDNIK